MSEATKQAPPAEEAKDKKEVKKEELVRAERLNIECNSTFSRPNFEHRFRGFMEGKADFSIWWRKKPFFCMRY